MVTDFLRSILSPSNFRSWIFFKFHGQINERSEIGRWIQTLSSLEENRSIVEIGTWNGRGSSKMIASGVSRKLSARPNMTATCKVTGFEIDKGMYHKSEKFLNHYDFFNVVYGSIVLPDELDNQDLSKEEQAWFQQDIQKMKTAPTVEDLIPDEIDLLILDGGEFSTYAEFKKLENRTQKWIVLDDTKTRKCQKILKEIKLNGRYLLLSESKERNGTAVVRVLS